MGKAGLKRWRLIQATLYTVLGIPLLVLGIWALWGVIWIIAMFKMEDWGSYEK